jgi:hypothetical protein
MSYRVTKKFLLTAEVATKLGIADRDIKARNSGLILKFSRAILMPWLRNSLIGHISMKIVCQFNLSTIRRREQCSLRFFCDPFCIRHIFVTMFV